MIPKYLFRALLLLLLLSSSHLLHAQRHRFTHVVDALPVLDSLSAAEIKALSFRVFRASAELRDSLRSRHKQHETNLQSLVLQMASAKADSSTAAEDLKSQEALIKTIRTLLKTTKEQVGAAEKLTSFSARTVDADSIQQPLALPRVFKQYNELLNAAFPLPVVRHDEVSEPLTGSETPTATPDSSAVKRDKVKEKKPKNEPSKPLFARYDAGRDPELNPPPATCSLLLNARDEFSGQIRQETDKVVLLRHTPAPLRALYEGRQQVLCEAAASRLGDQANLNLQFSIQDANARRSFGTLGRGSQIILRFIDGYTITLSNSRQDEGANDAAGNAVVYRGQYALDKIQFKKIQSTALDKIRVNWSAGYEDYEVQRVDGLQVLLRCIQ